MRTQPRALRSRLIYEQLGYVWCQHLTDLGYKPQDAKQELEKLDAVVADMRWLAVRGQVTVVQWDTDKDGIYRVCIDPLTQKVEVTHFGIDCLDPSELGIYADVSGLPSWMQDKVAVLSIMPFIPPTTSVEGVGQRINETTFWIIRG